MSGAAVPKVTKLGMALAAVVIAAIFFYFARPGLDYYFTDDDIMNLRQSWPAPASKFLVQIFGFAPQAYRPMGLLFYRGMLTLVGLHPRPFHWVCFGLLLLNVFLLYSLVRQLTGSKECAALAALIGAFHSRMDALYATPSSVYDILCFTFYFAFLVLYIHWRQADAGPHPWPAVAGLLLLYVLALSTKEMAVTLPAILLVYEFLYRPPKRRETWLLLIATIALTGLFCLRKLSGETPLTISYRPQYTLTRLFENWQGFLPPLVYGTGAAPVFIVVLVWLELLRAAWVLRSRAFALGCALILIGPLPVCFVEPRGITVTYVPFLSGWPICLAVLILHFRDWLLEQLRWASGGAGRRASAVAIFASVALLLTAAHIYDRPNRFSKNGGKHDTIREFKTEVMQLHPTVPRGATILLLDDPFETREWTPASLLQLYYRDPDLNIMRMKQEDQRAAIAQTKFVIIMTSKYGHMVDVPASDLPLPRP